MSCVSLRLNSRCWLRSRTPSHLLSRVMGPAGPGSAAPPDAGSPSAPAANAASAAPPVVPSPSHEVAASLLRSASLRAASPRTRTRSRSPAPLPKRAPRRSSSVASGLRGSVALAESGLVTGLATKSCPRSRLLSCAFPASLALSTLPQSARSHLSRPLGFLHPSPWPLRPLVPRSLRSTPTTNGTLSLTHTASHRLLESACSRQASPPSAQSCQALHVEGHLICSLRSSVRFRLVRHRCSRVCSGYVHTSGGHVEVLVDMVLSCGS